MEFSHRLVWMQMGSAEAPSTPFRSVEVPHWVTEREGDSSEEILCDKIEFSVAQWVKINTLFKDYPIDQIMYNWKDIAFS